MLGTVLTHLLQLGTSLISSAMTLTQQLLSKIIGVLTVIRTLFVDSLTNLQSQYVLTVQKFRPLVAQFTTLESLIKVVCTNVRLSLIQIGSRLVTTVRQTLQRVMSLRKKGN